MNKIKTLFHCLIHDRRKIKLVLLYKFSRLYSDKKFLERLFKLRMQKELNLDNPQSFSEKLQWLKLYNRKPEYTLMVDKYEAKKYVADIIGKEYIIPTIGVWDRVEDIDWEALPNQFVLKCTHDSGGIVICKDKANLDIKMSIKKLEKSMKRDYFYDNREWPYKNVKKRIIAEQFIDSEGHQDLPDYKFFCFNGEPKYCQVIRDRNSKMTIDFYDMEWSHMPFIGLNPVNPVNPVAKNGLKPVMKPKYLSEMVNICQKLATGIPFSRIDLYSVNEKIYFGEITFFPASGLGEFTPKEWNYIFGSWITLPN